MAILWYYLFYYMDSDYITVQRVKTKIVIAYLYMEF